MKLTPASMEVRMRASAPAWSTLPIIFQMPAFSAMAAGLSPAKVMVPRQILETRSPVLPRVLYCMWCPLDRESQCPGMGCEGRAGRFRRLYCGELVASGDWAMVAVPSPRLISQPQANFQDEEFLLRQSSAVSSHSSEGRRPET